jgi:hypothetical protein
MDKNLMLPIKSGLRATKIKFNETTSRQGDVFILCEQMDVT